MTSDNLWSASVVGFQCGPGELCPECGPDAESAPQLKALQTIAEFPAIKPT